MTLDSHHHFWRYNSREYDWIGPEMAVLQRDFLPADLKQEIAAAGIDGVISVQARQSLDETRWLLELAAGNDFIRGVVGWVPLVSPDVQRDLETLTAQRKLRSVRHVLQGEADDRYMLRDDFNRGVSLLQRFGLVYDILIFERHLPQTAQFIDRHPNQVFVLDHIAKPKIKAGELEPWRSALRELARRRHVYCKVSGMVTEADWKQWTPAQLRPYFDAVLEAFGPSRLMFGSDWPVCLVACPYGRWANIVREWTADLSPSEQERVFGGTAAQAYGLE